MTNPTANRAYTMPVSTDLVTGLPTQFATFGDAVDLDMATKGGYATTATAAGTTTLTLISARNQRFTGVTTQTVVMPVVSTLALGNKWKLQNKSTGALTVNSSGGNLIISIPAGYTYELTCILVTGTTSASWDYDLDGSTAVPTPSYAWVAYNPTVTPNGGSLTAYTATGKYLLVGKMCIFIFDILITTVGTATGSMNVTLPTTPGAAIGRSGGAMQDYAVSGNTASAAITTTSTRFEAYQYGGSSPLSAGAHWVGSISYEVA